MRFASCSHINVVKKIAYHPTILDKFMCAEIQNPERDPVLYEIVKANMIHGLCGILNTNFPCMKECCYTKCYAAASGNAER